MGSAEDRFGFDRELQLRIRDKYDPLLEQKALEWVAALTGRPAPSVVGQDGEVMGQWLRSGVLLCLLLNAIRKGTIPERSIAMNPRNMLEERVCAQSEPNPLADPFLQQNIEEYLRGCRRLGIPDQDSFVLGDLHSSRSLSAVLQNIFAVARQAQVIPGFQGPQLGVRFSISIEEQQRRIQAKEQERVAQEERQRIASNTQLARRSELETQKREEMIKEMETNDIRRLHRQLTRGELTREKFHELAQKSDSHFKELRHSNEEIVSNSDIKFGVDIEIHEKRKKGYSLKREEQAMDWIEEVTGIHLDDFHSDLKSGVALCALINTIYPGVAPNPSTRDLPLMHRVCHFNGEFLALLLMPFGGQHQRLSLCL